MRPAYSVILFTTLSGAGYGLIAGAALMLVVGSKPGTPLLAIGLGLALVTVGLVASTFHLGRRERAWRALSQWRTSWLSREAVAAVATYAAALPLAGLLALMRPDAPSVRLTAGLTILGCLATVFCTAMIYASLRPVRQWRHWTVPVAYLFFALGSGGLMLAFLEALAGSHPIWPGLGGLVSLTAAWAVREMNWRTVHATPEILTTADATGLDRFGTVTPLDPPHTESNYLLREFGYQVARRHSRRLRALARLLGWGVPILAALLAAPPGLPHAIRLSLTGLAAIAALVGILIERWLFFAEATHTVMLYYGGSAT